MLRHACVLLLLSTLAIAADSPADRVDALFAPWNKTTSPGCAIAVDRNGANVLSRAYGMADLDHDLALSPSSVFHVASISKQFVAASIVLLQQQGKLSFDDPVRKYIPELPDFGKPVTIRHLLHHTSGLRDQWSLLTMAGWRMGDDVIRDEDVLWVVSRMKELNFTPGDRHLYSNTGFTLLAQVVKRVSGKSLRAFTQDEIFTPLGMTHTHFRDNHAEIVKNMAYGWERHGDTYNMSNPVFDTVGASSLVSTAEDLLLWERNFDNPKVGGRTLVDTLMTEFTLNDGKKIPYRFGITVGNYRGLQVVGHGGADAGYRADLERFPEHHLAVAILCNAVVNTSRLTQQVAEIYLGDAMSPATPSTNDPEKPSTPVAVASADYAGRYYSEEIDSTYTIAFHDGALTLERKKSLTHKLTSGPSADEFRVMNLGTVKFERDGSGKITGFRLSNGRVLNLLFTR